MSFDERGGKPWLSRGFIAGPYREKKKQQSQARTHSSRWVETGEPRQKPQRKTYRKARGLGIEPAAFLTCEHHFRYSREKKTGKEEKLFVGFMIQQKMLESRLEETSMRFKAD